MKERQTRRHEEVRGAILDAAREIVAKEGFKNLSIRKITKALDYSPAIVYHYFKDKDQLVESLVAEGYRKILMTVRSVQRNEAEPERELKEVFTRYIYAALELPQYYMAVMLNDNPKVLQQTGLLRAGIAKNSPTMQALCENIERGKRLGRYAPCDTESTAQVIWTATFGLIIKVIIEQDIPQEQVDKLIDSHFSIIFNGLMDNTFKEVNK